MTRCPIIVDPKVEGLLLSVITCVMSTYVYVCVYIYFWLFTACESVQEYIRFSPFELVFGHTVREPLKLLTQIFLLDDNSKLILLDHVSNIRHKLSSACDLARYNMQTAQSKLSIINAQDKDISNQVIIF